MKNRHAIREFCVTQNPENALSRHQTDSCRIHLRRNVATVWAELATSRILKSKIHIFETKSLYLCWDVRFSFDLESLCHRIFLTLYDRLSRSRLIHRITKLVFIWIVESMLESKNIEINGSNQSGRSCSKANGSFAKLNGPNERSQNGRS